MVQLDKLKKVGEDILNCEGSILALYKVDNEYYLHSFLNDNSGKVFYKTSLENLLNFYGSRISVWQLLLQSEDVNVSIVSPFSKIILINKNELINRIHCGSEYYKNFPSSTK